MKFLVSLAVICALICALPGSAHAASPAAQCAGQGTSDTLHPVPQSWTPAINKTFGTAMPASMVAAGTVYRCSANQVLVCSTGANLNCGKADTSRTPGEGAIAWCKQNPQSDFIPAYAAGHETIYSWACQNSTPIIERQVQEVDSRGFVSEYWKKLN